MATRATPNRATVSACRCTLSAMRRRPITTSCSPLISATMTYASSRNVVSLMPPAVLALPPPMNIRAITTPLVSGFRSV